MKLTMPLPKRVFFIVTLVAMIAMLVYITQHFSNAPALVMSSKVTNTIALTGLDIGESLGYDYSALTGAHLDGLTTRMVVTNEGKSDYTQTLRLRDIGTHSFPGASIQFTQNNEGETGTYLVFDKDHEMFEYEVQFSNGLNSEIVNGKLPDLDGERLKLLGTYFTIVDSKIDTGSNRVELKMFSKIGSVRFRDIYNDYLYDDNGAEVNGDVVHSKVMINGYQKSNDVFTIESIKYRLMPWGKRGGDNIYVPLKHGTQQFLQQPQGMLNPSFEIIFAGMGDVITKSAPTTSGKSFLEITNSAKNQYNIYFTTNTNRYKLPLAYLSGGITFGDDNQALVLSEGNNNANFNINRNDFFVVSSGTNINDYTNIILYDRMDYSKQTLYYGDYNGGTKEARFDGAGHGQIMISGHAYDFYVSAAGNHPIVVDQNGDGNFNGARPDWVLAGGLRLRVQGGGASATVKVIVPRRLFDEAIADAITTIDITSSGSTLDLSIANQASISMQGSSGSIEQGMTNFGLMFTVDEHREPAKLKVGLAGTQTPVYSSSGGQSQGTVIITLEKEKFQKKK